MDISGISSSLIQPISNGATGSGAARCIDLADAQGTRYPILAGPQLIEPVAQGAPDAHTRLKQNTDVRA